MTTHEELRGDDGNVVPLEPLAPSRGSRGIGTTMHAAFDVMYEADEPLTIDEIAERSFERVHPAVRYHAKRWYLRRLMRQRQAPPSPSRGPDERRAWREHLGHLLRQAAERAVVLREGDRFVPNPAKPPNLERAEGGRIRYTREAWSEVSAADRAIGDIQAMGMEADRVLGDLDTDALRQAVALVARRYLNSRVDERVLRHRLRWLMERPSTDAGRAWLLTELVRRAYG